MEGSAAITMKLMRVATLGSSQVLRKALVRTLKVEDGVWRDALQMIGRDWLVSLCDDDDVIRFSLFHTQSQ